MSQEKGITRVQGGWLARHYWGKPKPISQYFYDREDGHDPAISMASAERWLKRMQEEYPAPTVKGRKPTKGYTVGIAGIRSSAVYVAWTSYPDGVQHKKEFSYTDDLSKKAAEKEAEHFYKARVREFEA